VINAVQLDVQATESGERSHLDRVQPELPVAVAGNARAELVKAEGNGNLHGANDGFIPAS
jgi:hypothetical protein